MRVIFIADVPGSGLAGEVKEVKNGFARNFLIPKNLAVLATHDQLQRIESIRKAGEERRIKEEQDLRVLAERLTQLSVTLTAKSGPTGRFYGAITSAQIAEELSRLTEREFDRRTVHLEKLIHEPGIYQTEIRMGYGISSTIPVTAEGEGPGGERIQAQVVTDAEAEGAVSAQAEVATDTETEGAVSAQAEVAADTETEGTVSAEAEVATDAEAESVVSAEAEVATEEKTEAPAEADTGAMAETPDGSLAETTETEEAATTQTETEEEEPETDLVAESEGEAQAEPEDEAESKDQGA